MGNSIIVAVDYSVAYFDCITVFKALWRRMPVKGGVHTCYVDVSNICASTQWI